MIANFTVQNIRSGVAGFVGAHQVPLHVVEVKCSTGEGYSAEISGSPYDGVAYMKASKGKLTVPDGKLFKAYLAHKIERDGIQVQDASVDRVFLVGAFLDNNGKLIPSDSVTFPQGREECWYHQHTFAPSGSRKIFHRIAKLQRGDAARVVEVWGLGTAFKPALGWAYPHCAGLGESGTGKDTICTFFRERLGWPSIAGPTEFATAYRSKKAVANAVMPIQIQEIGRMDHRARRYFVEVANLAYNLHPTTHGHLDKTFSLCAPLLVWGQDLGIEDVALSAKMIRVPLKREDKDPDALRRLRRRSYEWPMRSWIEFLCNWAAQQDVRALVEDKAAWLQSKVDDGSYEWTSNTDRTFWNYGILLVVAEALTAFGVPVSIDRAVVELVEHHVVEIARNRSTIARQVIRDLLIEIQRPDARGSFIHDLNVNGLFFKPENALKELRCRGYEYDISEPRTLINMLKEEGIGTPSVLHWVGRNQSRYFHIPAAKLAEFDFRRGGAGTDDDGIEDDDDEL